MQKKVEQFIERWNMISEGDKIVTGVSGGADSVCLLVLLDELCKQRNAGLYVVHVNHGIRGEAAGHDEEYVRSLCKEREIPLELVRANIPQIAKERKLSEEEAGRMIRREAFERVMEREQANKIALAHHADDNAETFFWNLARGSKLKGLGGIYPVNGVYIRPLLCVGRREIEGFLEKRGIEYCIDATNLDDTYTRNRIRNHVIPYFQEQINSRTVEHINGTMTYLREVQSYLEMQEQAAFEQMTRPARGGVLMDKTVYEQIPELIRGMAVYHVLAEVSGQNKDLEEIHVKQTEALVKQQTGRKIDLPYGMVAERVYEGVVIRKKQTTMAEEEEPAETFSVKLEDGKRWKMGKWDICCRVFENTEDIGPVPKKTFTKWFDYDIIGESVELRLRRPGDRITINRFGGSKTLKRYFVDEKIPQEERKKIPLLVSHGEVGWIVGYRQSPVFQVTEQTKRIVEITINGGS